jgi:hypothetical protein
MDVQPPWIVEILMKPIEPVGKFISRLLPHPNIGTPEHPLYEGTPLDAVVGLALILFGILLYPLATYFLLALLSKILRRRTGYQNNLK